MKESENCLTKENSSRFVEHVDTSIIAKFPPGFFQKGEEHLRQHPDEQFTMQVTDTHVFLRRMKKDVNGVRPKDKVNGQIISWTFAQHQQADDNR